MGGCLEKANPKEKIYREMPKRVSTEESKMLHLIYTDLAERISENKINLENFLLFFHKNGYWGERLFKEFDYDANNLISEPEFIQGIGRIFKSSEKEKIQLLFKFFAGERQEGETWGVGFHEFLTMLYNYPKEDLRQILNDREFIEHQLMRQLVPLDNNKNNSTQPCYSFQSHTNLRHLLPSNATPNEKKHNRNHGGAKGEESSQSEALPSLIGKKIAEELRDRKGDKMVHLQYDQKALDIRAINIQQLVKKFARKIFKEAHVEVRNGKLALNQFQNWLRAHSALYLNYYEGFHYQVWGVNPKSHNYNYLAQYEKVSAAKFLTKQGLKNVRFFLNQSMITIAEQKYPESPIQVICLQGLAVRRIFDVQAGFGVEISHRDEAYKERRFYFINEKLLLQWMDLLKFYKGESLQTRYQIGKKIGAGKFSVVYQCRSLEDGNQYAIKQIATYKLQIEAKNLIAHESSIMQTLSHPLLLEFKECIQTNRHIYIITQLVRGKDLFEFVKEHDFLDEYDAAKICQQIIVGVREMHRFQIVHRDLKPENIMVVLDGDKIQSIKIIDFGFSNYLYKLIERKDLDDILAGTPNYIAPQILKEEEFDLKIDNFAIGVILYFMLTGKLPFHDYCIPDILQNTIDGIYKFGDKVMVSDQAKDLVDQLLKNNPKERISLQKALKHPWFKSLDKPRPSMQRKPSTRARSIL